MVSGRESDWEEARLFGEHVLFLALSINENHERDSHVGSGGLRSWVNS